jgi:hypothetical protein
MTSAISTTPTLGAAAKTEVVAKMRRADRDFMVEN